MSKSAKTLFNVAASCLLMWLPGPVEAQMRDIFKVTDTTSDSHVEYHKFDIAKGKEVQLADLKGPGKVTYFYITDDNAGKWHPGLVLKVYWDDAKEPSINVPLADFFGVFAGKTIDFQSRLISVNHMCYMSYLPMPFSKRARFVLANDGEEDYSRIVAYGIDYEKGEAFARETSRLHSQWNRSNPTKDGVHTLFETKGRGHYIGNFLYTHSRYPGWWGEGDTLFHLDGKAITHTPGTKDEYGSCWAFEKLYSYLDSGYIEMENGRNRMYRWYYANPVRFKDSLKVEVQNQRLEDGQVPSKDDYVSIAYWYQDEPQAVALLSYKQRVAASEAAEYPKKP